MTKPPTNDLDIVLSNVLRIGLVIAFLTTLLGGILLFWQSGNTVVDYHIFKGEPDSLKAIRSIITSSMHGEGIAIVQLGILLMIATPVSRVLLCVIMFFLQKDYLYVVLSSFVLGVLLYSFFHA